ncbi:hypothetical protein GCM10027059_37780 [Myceligenerans halotolerans]
MEVDRLRVLFVVPSARRAGGGDVWLAHILSQLPARGVEVMVAFEQTGELVEHAGRAGCRTAVLGSQAVGMDAVDQLIAPLAAEMRAIRPDATIMWSPRAQLYGARAHEAAGRPGMTLWVQHVMPSDFWLHSAASEQPSDAVICVSTAVRDRQASLYPGTNAVVVHPGVAAPALADRAAARALLGMPETVPAVGVVGRIEPWKGQDVAVRSLALLAERGYAAELVLVGQRHSPTWPDFADETARLIDALGLTGRVHFTDHQDDVGPALGALDVLVCSSREEGFGLAVVEAMASGVPVVATCCGGPEDIIVDGVHGLLVPTEDPVALGEAVHAVLADAPSRAAMTAAAAARARDRFTPATTTDALLGVIRATLEPGSRQAADA